MIKDQQYWKDYNQKRREYFRQKQREHRTKLKGSVVDSSAVVDKVEVAKVVDRPKEKVVDITKPKLWTDYYNGKKPFCSGCQQQNIPLTVYAFCSITKDSSDPNFPNLYFCQVYHWTIYQGQGKT